MNPDNLVTAETLASALKMAVEGTRKKPGLMKSAVPHMELIYKYVDNIVTAKDKGKWVIAHRAQQPLEFIGEMVEQYEVDGIISDIVRFCTYNTWGKFDLKKQMDDRGVPILELDLEYGHSAGAQVAIRVEAFMEMLESRAS